MRKSERPIAQVCLYGTRDTGFAYLASGPELASPILAKGGWSAEDESTPSGRYTTLTEIVQIAKDDLRARGIERGVVLVCFPGGAQCARTPIDRFESVGNMKLEPAPLVAISAEAIDKVARKLDEPLFAIASSPPPAPIAKHTAPKHAAPKHTAPKHAPKRARSKPAPLGLTASGKPVPRVPVRLAKLEKAASQATGEHGLFDEKAYPAIHAAHIAEDKHFASYTKDFTVEDHREAIALVAARKWDGDKYLRYASNGIITRHERAIEAAEQKARREAQAW